MCHPTPDGDAFDHSKYAQAVGCLMWIAQSSRPDISYAVSALAQAQSSPTTGHWTGIKRVMRYLSTTADLNIHYEQSSSSPHLTGWADADHAGDVTDRKSRTGYVYMVAGGTVAWRSKKQQSVALSTAESELIALSLAAQECIHLRRLLSDIGFAQDDPTLLNGDNEAAIRIATNDAGASSRLKHVAVRHFFVREACKQGAISIIHVPSASNIADVMTKSLPRDPFLMFRRTLGLK